MGPFYTYRRRLIKYDYSDEIQYASDLCRGYEPAVDKAQKELFGKLLYIANQFIKPARGDDSGYIYEDPNSKYTYYITPDVINTIHWLSKKIQSLSCKYKGKNEAKLYSFITTCLGGKKYGLNEFLKWHYGNSYNIPSSINKLPQTHIDIFIDLCRRLRPDEIAVKHEIDDAECIAIINDIRTILHHSGLIDRIQSPIEIDIFTTSEEEDDNSSREINIADDSNIDISLLNDIEIINNTLKKIIQSLEVSEKKLLLVKYGIGESSKDIFTTFKNDDFLKSLNIDSVQLVDRMIEKIITKVSKIIKEKKQEIYEDYNLYDNGILKKSFRVYFLKEVEKNNHYTSN